MKGYTLLEHTADIRIRVKGKSLGELFSRAGLAVFDILARRKAVPGLPSPRAVTIKRAATLTVHLSADSIDELFVRWLNELLSLAYAKELVFVRVNSMSLTGNALKAKVTAEPMEQYHLNTEIKAATYHKLSVKKIPGGWQAEVILDV